MHTYPTYGTLHDTRNDPPRSTNKKPTELLSNVVQHLLEPQRLRIRQTLPHIHTPSNRLPRHRISNHLPSIDITTRRRVSQHLSVVPEPHEQLFRNVLRSVSDSFVDRDLVGEVVIVGRN